MPLVLLYHRIGVTSSDPWALTVAPDRFADHLRVIRASWEPVRLTDLIERLRRGLTCDRQVAVTFDDGYVDNLHEALPALERSEVSATFFIPSGGIGADREFWWDELDTVLLQPGTLPRHLTLIIGDQRFEWDLASACSYTAREARQHEDWVAWEPPPTARHALYAALWTRCRALSGTNRNAAIRQLRDWAASEPVTRPTRRCLNPTELETLGRSPWATLGAHTVTHPSLATLSSADQRLEIETGKVDLERVLGAAVSTFAYPFGKRSDYTVETLTILRDAGFLGACTNEPGVLTRTTHPFEIPRLFVRDMSGADFQQWLLKSLQ